MISLRTPGLNSRDQDRWWKSRLARDTVYIRHYRRPVTDTGRRQVEMTDFLGGQRGVTPPRHHHTGEQIRAGGARVRQIKKHFAMGILPLPLPYHVIYHGA